MVIVHVQPEEWFALLPVLMVWLVGIVLALVRWRQHPRASLLALIAFLGLAGTAAANTYVNAAFPLILRSAGLLALPLATAGALRTMLQNLVSVVWWVLLLIALFARRPAAVAAPAAQAGVQPG